MPFSARKANFNALKKLSVKDRIDAINDKQMGSFLISMLTPTQAAELFPHYYIERNPNISGFIKALPSSLSAAKQKSYEEQLNNTASGSSAGANFESGGYRKKWQKEMDDQRAMVSRKGQTPLPQLTPEQRSSFDALKNGDISINDERMKWLKNVPPESLKEAGIDIKKNDKGEEVFHYSPKQFSDEEVKRSMNVSDNARAIEKVANKLNIAPKDLAAVMHYESAGTMSTSKWGGANGDYLGLIQFGPSERKRFGVYAGQPFAEQVEAAGNFLEKRGLKRWLDNHPNASIEEKRIALYSTINAGSPDESNWYKSDNNGKDNVITHTQRIFREHYAAAEKFMGPTGGDDPITRDYSKEAIEARRQTMMVEEEARNIGKLASITQPNGTTVPTNDGTAKLNTIDAWKQAGTKNCGRGTRLAASQLFGDSRFAKQGIGGDGTAASLSRDNDYFQRMGYYKNKQPITDNQVADPSYLNSLPVGTIISAAGGNSKGQGHVQIKLGNGRWVSFFDQGNKVLTPSQTKNYHDYAVHLPNEKGLSRMQELGYATNVTTPVPPPITKDIDNPYIDTDQTAPEESEKKYEKHKNNDAKVDAISEAKDIKPLSEITQPQQPKAAAPVVEPKPAPISTAEKYKVNMSGFRDMVKKDPTNTYPAFMIDMASDAQIIDGFNNDPRIKEAGVHIDEKGVLHIKDRNNPGVKEFMQGKDLKGVMTKIEEEKKKEQKEQPKVEAAKQPEIKDKVESKEKVEVAKQPEIKDKDKKENEQPPTIVKPKAEGGTTKVGTEKISAYPIGGLQGDNAIVVDAQKKPLFTMNTNETAVMNPDTKTVDVHPKTKTTDIKAHENVKQETINSALLEDFHSDIEELKKRFDIIKPMDIKNKHDERPMTDFDPTWLHKLSNVTEQPYRNSTAQRAFYRAGGYETGEPNNSFHYSKGNRS